MRRFSTVACCAIALAAGCNEKATTGNASTPDGNGGVVIVLEDATRVVVEVESGEVNAPFEVVEDGQVGGAGYVSLPEQWVDHKEINPPLKKASDGSPVSKKGLRQNPLGSKLVPNGSVSLKFRVPKTAVYAFWARVNFHCSCGDSFHFNVDAPAPVDTDGNGEYDEHKPPTIQGSTYQVWKWYGYKGRKFKLEEGEHRIDLYPREDGVKIDQVLFAEVPEPPLDPHIPQGVEESYP